MIPQIKNAAACLKQKRKSRKKRQIMYNFYKAKFVKILIGVKTDSLSLCSFNGETSIHSSNMF